MNGQDLKALRMRRGWSQRQMMELLNGALGKDYRNKDQVGRWERGQRKIPADVDTFLEHLLLEEQGAPQFEVLDGDRQIPFEPEPGDTMPPPPSGPSVEDAARNVAALVGGGGYARVCEELWELVATGVGMVGAVTGSQKLQDDGKIILGDKVALGKAYGKLAEQNATFRSMLAGMTGGGAWLEVALVSGITAGKLMRNHQARPIVAEPPEPVAEPDNGRMYGDSAVIDLPV